MRIVVVGGGMQGRVIAENLAARPEKPEVVVADIQEPSTLPANVTFQKTDILDKLQAVDLAKDADAAVLAVPSSISHAALANLIKAGVPVADVSFTPNPPLDLDSAARSNGVCCVVDCGVAPGLSHLLIGRAYSELKGLDSVKILVGGMPESPPPVFRHAVYFNPHDLISEYVRPARARKGGQDIAPAPLDLDAEQHVDADLGHLEAFLSDGLRSLLTSYPDVRDMAELTLRWPGHLDTMRGLREMGILDDQKSTLAFGNTLAKRYPDTQYSDVLLMLVEATRGSQRRVWRLIDRYTNGQSAMSRTTGYTTAAIAIVLARKQFTEPGVHPPEFLGRDSRITADIIADLAERQVIVREVGSAITA
jgi:saccharopine dehydrogenase-like NADP-dependent oxidoreductase